MVWDVLREHGCETIEQRVFGRNDVHFSFANYPLQILFAFDLFGCLDSVGFARANSGQNSLLNSSFVSVSSDLFLCVRD